MHGREKPKRSRLSVDNEHRVGATSHSFALSPSVGSRVLGAPYFPFAGSPFRLRGATSVRRISVDPLGMAEADITSVVPCGSVQFRPV